MTTFDDFADILQSHIRHDDWIRIKDLPITGFVSDSCKVVHGEILYCYQSILTLSLGQKAILMI